MVVWLRTLPINSSSFSPSLTLIFQTTLYPFLCDGAKKKKDADRVALANVPVADDGVGSSLFHRKKRRKTTDDEKERSSVLRAAVHRATTISGGIPRFGIKSDPEPERKKKDLVIWIPQTIYCDEKVTESSTGNL